jgi:hypothetical protein
MDCATRASLVVAGRRLGAAYPSWSTPDETLYYHDPADRRLIGSGRSRRRTVRSAGCSRIRASHVPGVSPAGEAVASARRCAGRWSEAGPLFEWPCRGAGAADSWSPRRRLLAFSAFATTPRGLGGSTRSYVGRAPLGRPSGRPAWSLDGKYLTFDTSWRCRPRSTGRATDDIRRRVRHGSDRVAVHATPPACRSRARRC